MVRIKFCGITREEDALAAVRLGVHVLGFVFVKESPRYIEPRKAENIVSQLPPFVFNCGVFLNHSEDEIRKITSQCHLDIVQLHGEEPVRLCEKLRDVVRVIKAFRLKSEEVLNLVPQYSCADAVLLDAFDEETAGGSGKTCDWEIARKARNFGLPLILSGGLTPDNVKEAISMVNPYAVDVSSGIEAAPGIKDHELMGKFLAAVWEEEWGM